VKLARKTFLAPSPLAVSLLAQLGMSLVFIAAFALVDLLGGRATTASAAPLLFFAYFALVLVPKRIIAGTDGFRVSWLLPGAFVPYAQVKRVSADGLGVNIDLRDGTRVWVQYERQLSFGLDLLSNLFANQKPAVLQRIEQGAEALAHAAATEDAGDLLSRQGRTGDQWLASLRALGSPEGSDYRAARVAPDLLWRIAESVASRPGSRAAAAVALRATLDDAGRARLERLAQETAAPRVRVVLEAAARSSDEEELARALVECEEASAELK
jgi:hypothetical protein